MLPKDYTEFKETLEHAVPHVDWPETLKALWFDAKGDWESSHNIAQDMHNELGSWMHAYLHRKEGDRFNAGYWYRQAEKSYPEMSLEAELQEMVAFVLERC
ncbi:hypothetical protein BFP77_15350 [Maribacter sp. 4U21]|uniref:hypothetical protein n=1 Tax=Maribacter sp. 4U21 TaxID=1889779 RepID=UPI000C14D111|nr:hypothetical protein [Maribacter sp. 4U21]PIB23691.1 hypothetical protein BFP77_15350 [Maribacter sp. 4U21]